MKVHAGPAQALLGQGRAAEALAETRALTVEGDPSAVEVLQMRAEALCASGNMERALKLYEEVRCAPVLAGPTYVSCFSMLSGGIRHVLPRSNSQ